MPKSPLKDYLWVIEKLMQRPRSLAELQESYRFCAANDDRRELQAKTFYNWRTKIEDIFNIKIEYIDGVYQITDSDVPERRAALEWLVQSLSINTLLSHSRDLSRRILLEDIPSGKTYLNPIIEAMKESRRIKITYARFNQGVGIDTVIEPYCLKVDNRRWYLLCRVPDENSTHEDYPELDRFGCIRIYALDRILDLETLDETFRYPDDFDPDVLFKDHFGVCIAYGVPVERVLIKVRADYRNYIESLPLHHSQTLIEEDDDDNGIYAFQIHPTIDFFRALLSLGIDAEILEPESLREAFAEEAAMLNNLYNSDCDE